MEWIDRASKKEETKGEILSFGDYMNLFKEKPLMGARPSYQYLLDMLKFYGKSDKGEFKLFKIDEPDSPAVYGQVKTQQEIFENLQNFREEGFNNKFLLLVGPNGSSKSSLVRKIMKGAENYSQTEEGALYTFSWIFPIDNFIKGSLGLNTQHSKSDLQTYAYLEDKDITAIITSELKDHPLLLIPTEYRTDLIKDVFAKHPDELKRLTKTYFFKGDLSKRNRMIYDALLKNYKGDHAQVLKHIRIERFNISKRYSTGAVTIEPQIHVDARLQQITMDKRLGSLPPSLQSLNLFSMQGEVVLANRGILEFSDLLKRPLDTYKYLLMTMETSDINIAGILTELDIFFIGTSNEIHLSAFKQHPDFNSFKGRFNFVRVPYLLKYSDEAKIYEKQVDGLKNRTRFEPHTIDYLCQFSVLSRLRAPQEKNFANKTLGKIVAALNPLEKAFFLNDGQLPSRLDSESKQVLSQNGELVENEFDLENLYEGKFGVSPRDLKNTIYELSSKFDSVSLVEVFDYLEKLILEKNRFDFLNMTAQGDYHHPVRFIALIREHAWNIFDSELRGSLGLIDDRSYEDYLKRYITNVTAQIKGEKIKNEITGKFESVDDYFIKEFEKNIDLAEDAKTFRSHLMSRLGAYALDNPKKEIIYTQVFPSLVDRLKESFREEQKKFIQDMSKHIVYYEAEFLSTEYQANTSPLTEDNRQQIELVLSNLTKKYGYSKKGAFNLIKQLIKDRY
jgi:serine protein kinase